LIVAAHGGDIERRLCSMVVFLAGRFRIA
jgi:hypothetical protein